MSIPAAAAAVTGTAAAITGSVTGTITGAASTAAVAPATTLAASIENSFHINTTLLNYLPIIVLVVILLIGFVSWDVMKGNWSIFVTLIIAFIFVVYIHYLNPDRFLTFKGNNSDTPFLPEPPGTVFDIFSNKLLYILLPIGIFILGVSLGYGSIALSRAAGTYDPSIGLITMGSILIGGAVISLIILALKRFSDELFNNISFTTILSVLALCAVSGIPMLVRGKKIKDDLGVKLKDDEVESKKLRENLANTGADTMLGIGVFFQIAVFIALGYYVWSNTHDTNGIFRNFRNKMLLIIFIICIFALGGVFLYKSLRGPGFDSTNTDEVGSFENKPFLVHGIIWLIAGIILCLVLFGQTSQFIVHRYSMYIILLVFVSFIIVSAVKTAEEIEIPTADTVLSNDRDYMNSGYYKQLRAEVIKDLKQKDPTADIYDGSDTSKDPDIVKAAMKIRLDEIRKKSQDPTGIVFGVFASLSVIIAVFILMCYNVRLKMAECGYIPLSFEFKNAFLYTANGECTSTSQPTNLNDEEKTKIKKDKMLSKDWDNILSNTAQPPPFSIWSVRFAKWFSLIPFLSVILLVMWVSILFTNVTTSTRTSDWIASNFSGDMFSRVKELVDTFFIVLIVGLLLCGILLFPIVKELNVGGLDSILKFAQSIQVWQYDKNKQPDWKNNALAIVGFVAVFLVGLSFWWKYLNETRKGDSSLPIVPDNWGWAIAFVVLLAMCTMPTFFNFYGTEVNADFAGENMFKRAIRQILTMVYLVPWMIVVLFRVVIFGIASLSGNTDIVKKRDEELAKLKFWEWDANTSDFRMFPTDKPNTKPSEVTSVPTMPSMPSIPSSTESDLGIDETKVSAIGKLIKVILLTISFVILILAVIYYVYKIDATNRSGGVEQDTSSGGFVAQMNSPTAHTIYVIMAIVGIAGLVAYLRDKFTKTNAKTPENYLFDDFKPEDSSNPLRQLAFGATHIVYVILMVVVWVYDRDKDDKERMSVTGMTILGIAILFFHYTLEFLDNVKPADKAGAPPVPAPPSDLLTNIRFITNTVFFVVLCALAYYKQHGVMVVLIIAMFIFHLTKSIIGLKLLKLLWLSIIYIPCLFLGLLQSSQSVVGDTTRPIWIIVAIELLLIAILYGGPYLLNYIGASASQMVATPVTLNHIYDTNLNTQSPQIFIYHNTGIDRTPEDKAANCPAEEKKRYNYSISGWFILNNNISNYNKDLEIFNFGDVPRLTYNSSTHELKLWCNTLGMSGNPNSKSDVIYNSKSNYNSISGKTPEKKTKMMMVLENEELDVAVPLQKWNYFVVNYNGKTMDLFLNNKLIGQSNFIMPDILMKPITIGATTDNKGLNGSICNFSFHKTPMTKEQIRWTYNMFKSQNPPIIGTKTIEDEVKEAGSTTVYSK